MSKEKLQSATKYADDLKNRLSSSTPVKHKGHPETYKQFLQRELDTVNKQIDGLKLSATDKK